QGEQSLASGAGQFGDRDGHLLGQVSQDLVGGGGVVGILRHGGPLLVECLGGCPTPTTRQVTGRRPPPQLLREPGQPRSPATVPFLWQIVRGLRSAAGPRSAFPCLPRPGQASGAGPTDCEGPWQTCCSEAISELRQGHDRWWSFDDAPGSSKHGLLPGCCLPQRP